MELKHYMALLWRWAWLIALGTIFAGAAAFAVSKAMTPVYRATTTLQVNQAAPSTIVTDYTGVLTSQQLAKTYSELIKKRPILQVALDHLNVNLPYERAITQLDVQPVRDTTLINVSWEDESPTLAASLVNEIAAVFIKSTNDSQHSRFASSEDNLAKELSQIQADMSASQKALDKARAATPADQNEVARLQTVITQNQSNYAGLLKSYEDLRVTEARSFDSISVAEPATVPDRPVRPQTLLNTLLAAVVGAMLAIGVAFLAEYLDDTIKSPDDVREALDIVTMGVIAHFENKPNDPNSGFPVVNSPRSPVAEAFRSLRTNIQFASLDRKIGTILITSPNPGEGKTTIAVNLAAALAQAGQSVALIDADLRRPSIHRLLNIPNSGGLTNVALANVDRLNGFLQHTAIPGLKALPSGPLPPNPAELLGSGRVAQIIEDVKSQVEVVIIDAPPSLVVTDPAVLAKRVDAVLLVLEPGSTRRDAARHAVEGLQQVGANVIGAVLNKLSPRRSGYYYRKYYHHHNYYAPTGEGKKHQAGSRDDGNPQPPGNGYGPDGPTGLVRPAYVAPMNPPDSKWSAR